jgi:SMI1/KNR4 family protein SUKH-1
MSSPNPPHDVWSRLRAYGEEFPVPYPEHRRWYERQVRDGVIYADTVVDDLGDEAATPYLRFPPATEEQLRATEERLGFPLPPDLRRLYAEVANGGLELGLVQVFHGAIGGCGEYAMARNDGRTIEELTSDSAWQLHPRIEEALLRHPGCYVIEDSLPSDFLIIGEDYGYGSIVLNVRTGSVFYESYWDDLPDVIVDDSGFEPVPLQLSYLEAVAPSLSAWLASWLDDPRGRHHATVHEMLVPAMVEAADLPDSDVVWRGLYRFEPKWHVWERPPDDEDELFMDVPDGLLNGLP